VQCCVGIHLVAGFGFFDGFLDAHDGGLVEDDINVVCELVQEVAVPDVALLEGYSISGTSLSVPAERLSSAITSFCWLIAQ